VNNSPDTTASTEPVDDRISATGTATLVDDAVETETAADQPQTSPVRGPRDYGFPTGAFAAGSDPWTYVAIMGGQTTKVRYESGQVVGDALNSVVQCGELTLRRGDGRVVTVNGRRAPLDQSLEPNSVVQVTSPVSNG